MDSFLCYYALIDYKPIVSNTTNYPTTVVFSNVHFKHVFKTHVGSSSLFIYFGRYVELILILVPHNLNKDFQNSLTIFSISITNHLLRQPIIHLYIFLKQLSYSRVVTVVVVDINRTTLGNLSTTTKMLSKPF